MEKTTLVEGVRHTILPKGIIDHHRADSKIEDKHPLGDVYVFGKYGYVANGGGWLRFLVAHLSKFANQVFRDHLHKIVDAAVEFDKMFHDWSANFDPEAALLFAKKSEVYNRMTRDGLVGLIQFINDNAPTQDFGDTNPNTGRSCHEYRIGNEGSRVIYATFKIVYVDKHFDWQELFEKIQAFAKKKAHADEFTLTRHEFNGWVVRMWWD